MDVTGSGSCSQAPFDVSGVKSVVSSTTLLVLISRSTGSHRPVVIFSRILCYFYLITEIELLGVRIQ